MVHIVWPIKFVNLNCRPLRHQASTTIVRPWHLELNVAFFTFQSRVVLVVSIANLSYSFSCYQTGERKTDKPNRDMIWFYVSKTTLVLHVDRCFSLFVVR